jgi:hypothetical protein
MSNKSFTNTARLRPADLVLFTNAAKVLNRDDDIAFAWVDDEIFAASLGVSDAEMKG